MGVWGFEGEGTEVGLGVGSESTGAGMEGVGEEIAVGLMTSRSMLTEAPPPPPHNKLVFR